ncbi:MAG: hypothetical protein ACYC5F_09620 [Thermoleophilia bacterium]
MSESPTLYVVPEPEEQPDFADELFKFACDLNNLLADAISPDGAA